MDKKEKERIKMRKYRKDNPEYGKKRNQADYILKIKTEVLSHYGVNGKAQCCWEGCSVDDVDMLSLDHINNNGAEHRKQLVGSKHRCGGGINLYRILKKENYPNGFQTFCHNHQWKKEIVRRRQLTISMCEAA